MCVAWGVLVTREHSTPERVSPVRAARHWLPSPACAWLVSGRGPAGPGALSPGPSSPSHSPGPGGTPRGTLPEVEDPKPPLPLS